MFFLDLNICLTAGGGEVAPDYATFIDHRILHYAAGTDAHVVANDAVFNGRERSDRYIVPDSGRWQHTNVWPDFAVVSYDHRTDDVAVGPDYRFLSDGHGSLERRSGFYGSAHLRHSVFE